MGVKLNRQQKEAVRYEEGPILIIAGPGTGKTTVVTERVKWLIAKGKARPEEILALTFTEKAAAEMETRVDEAMPYGYTQMWISTFHAFCDRILRNEALEIGLDPRYRLMGEAEAVQFFRKHLFEFEFDYFRPLGNPTKFVEGLLSHFSRLADEDVTSDGYLAFTQSQKSKLKKQGGAEEEKLEAKKIVELAKAYEKYGDLKAKEGLMDFSDLISNTLRLFRERRNVLVSYRERFKYVLVDEFQDTNFAQNELAMMLGGKRANICVVGDDSQAIYRWRGAAISNILQFKEKYPEAKEVVLVDNYRSTQEILDRAYQLIQFNNPDTLEVKLGISKDLKSVTGEGGEKVEVIWRERGEDEAEAVAGEIGRLVKEGGRQFSDMAILVRANNHAESFVRALSRAGVPYQFLGPGRLFRQPEVMDVFSYLKLLTDVSDSVAAFRVLAMEVWGISGRDLAMLNSRTKRERKSLFEVCEEEVKETDLGRLGREAKGKLGKFMEMVRKHLGWVAKESAGRIAYDFLEESGMLAKLAKPETPGGEKQAANLARLFDKLKGFEESKDEAGVFAVVDWMELSQELGESPRAAEVDWTTRDAVNILTVHSAKGLEFHTVFMVNLVNQRFPSMGRRETIPIPVELVKEELPEGDYHAQEERRLFYVGMTRAREKLYFTGAKLYAGGKREKSLSPFVYEALGEKVMVQGERVEGEQLSLTSWGAWFERGKESEEEKVPVRVDYLSYSQMEAFNFCPLHYKLKYIWGLPTPPSVSASFGISVHEALKDFYRQLVAGRKGGEKELLEWLERDWVREGYENKQHEAAMFKKGERYLRGYLKSRLHRPEKLPVLLEEPFMFNVSGIKVGGKIDRVDDLGGGRIEIVDYKTGVKVPTQKEVDADLQMTFYALAANEVKHPVLGRKPEQVKLTFYYFDAGEAISTTRTKEQLEEAKKLVIEKKKEIETSDFACSGNSWCEGGKCEYRVFCQVDLG